MKASKHSVVLTAALTGLLGGTMSYLNAAPANALAQNGQSSNMTQQGVHQHSCAGKNSCKGQGGCKAGNHSCKGKNSCKGQGGCATDLSQAQMKKMMKRYHKTGKMQASNQNQNSNGY